MISMYDLTLYDFLLLCMHVFSFMLYIALGIRIIQRRKYLKWNSHIYPSLMVASFGIALVFGSDLVAKQNYNVFFHLFMWLFAFNQFAELFRLAEKYNKIEELQKKINMKNLTVILIICSILQGCGTRKAELEKLTKTHKETTEKLEKTIFDQTEKLTEKEISEQEMKKEIEVKKSEIEKIRKERTQLLEKLKEDKKDGFVIKDANGTVKVTDANGNTYEIPSIEGTQITKTSESSLTKELDSVTEILASERITTENLRFYLSQRDKTISEKEKEITIKNEQISKLQTNIQNYEAEKKKNSERKAYPIWIWLLSGFLVGVVTILLLMLQLRKR